MRNIFVLTMTAAGLLTACSNGEEGSTADFAEMKEAAAEPTVAESFAAADEAEVDAAGGTSSASIKVSLPQIAYSYQYGFRLAANQIAKTQRTHADLCIKQGHDVCHVLNMEQSGVEGDYATGTLQMEVAAPKARAFGTKLAEAVEAEGGAQISSAIQGEDLSKQIVDTEARLRTRRLLAERLTELLRTRKGSVKELVSAERAVAQVNEEIDQAASWLADMKGRVAFSKVTVEYRSGGRASGGFFGPIRDAFNDIGATLGSTVAALITLIAVLIPWLLVLALMLWILRRLQWWPFRTGRAKLNQQDSDT